MYNNVFDCTATSICLELSFSIPNKMLAEDGNFDFNNVGKYFMMYYNKELLYDKC
jgi:hypothetical protein